MMHDEEKIHIFYQSELGLKLYEQASVYLSGFLNDVNKRVLLIGNYSIYLSLFDNYNCDTVASIKTDKLIKFDKIFLIHYLEYESNLSLLFSQLENSLADGGEIIVLMSKLYSIQNKKFELTYKNIFLESIITSIMRSSSFVQIEKKLMLDEYFKIISIPIFARFLGINARLDSSCKIIAGNCEHLAS